MENVICVEGLYKKYRLGVIGHGTLSHDLQSWWAKIRGKEDPNAEISVLTSGEQAQVVGKDFWALRGIDLEIKQGELLGIIGMNGAGKSTLLKILSRITAPTKGNVKIKGRVASLLEVGTGFHPELTGRENIYLNGIILGMTKAEVDKSLEEIVDFSGVEKYIDTPVKRYSSGMRVRLGFAVAAHMDPEILIVDEVLAVGDAAFQKRCIGKMQSVGQEGRTVLFVSHNMHSIHKLCERCALLSYGKVEQVGSTAKMIDTYLSGQAKKEFNVELSEDSNEKDVDLFNIYKVQLLDENHNEIEHVFADQQFIVRFFFYMKDVQREYVIGANFFTQDGYRVGAIVSRGFVNFEKLSKYKKYSLDVAVKNIFTPGNIKMQITVKGRFGYAVVMDGFNIEVVPYNKVGSFTPMPGVVLIKNEWGVPVLT